MQNLTGTKTINKTIHVLSISVLCGTGLLRQAMGQAPPQGAFDMTQTLSDGAQRTTIAFSGLALMTGNLNAQSFFPPGKVADYTGFQYLRDNDPDNMGHNTSFLTRAANNMLYILTDSQVAQLKALAAVQLEQVNQYAYKRYPLMQAFRRLTDGSIPSGTTGLSLAAVKQASRELYLLDGQISFDRALLYANIYKSMTPAQKAYLDAMKGKGFGSWPDIPDAQVSNKMSGLPPGTGTLVMTYAGDIFSWYAGSLDADVYFCPERHGTYYGGFYIKDAPAVGHEGYSISESLTNTAGSALSDSSLGYVTAEQAALMSSLVDAQRGNLYAGTTNIVQIRTRIATLLRGLLTSSAASDSVKTQVLALSETYGDLDGENNYLYATMFSRLYATFSSSQKTRLEALRKSILSGTYADGTRFDFSVASTPYLYSDPIRDAAFLQPYIANTDYLFGASVPMIRSFTATPSTLTVGQATTLAWDVAGATSISLDNGVGTVTDLASLLIAPRSSTTYTLTASNTAGSVTAQAKVTVNAAASCTLAAAPASLTVASGASTASVITCGNVQGGFNTELSVTLTGAPAGVTASVSPATLAPGSGKTTLTVNASNTAAAGNYTLSVKAAGGSFAQTLGIPLTVTVPADFTLTGAAGSISAAQGAAVQTKFTTAHVGSFNSAIALSVTGPAGVSLSFSPATIAAPGDGSSVLAIAVAATVVPGTYTLTISGVAGSLTKTATLSLIVSAAPSLKLTASPATLNMPAGDSGTVQVVATWLGGLQAVSLAAGPLPQGITASFQPATINTSGGSSLVKVQTSPALPPGKYTLMITGNAPGVAPASVTIILNVGGPPKPKR